MQPSLQGRSLDSVQLEAAAGGRPDGLLGVVAEAVVPQPATGRCKREGARTSRPTHPVGQRRACVAAVHAACGDVGGTSGALSEWAGCVWGVHVRG